MMNERCCWFSPPISDFSLDVISALGETLPRLMFEAIFSCQVTESGCGVSVLLGKTPARSLQDLTSPRGKSLLPLAGFWMQLRNDMRARPHSHGSWDGAGAAAQHRSVGGRQGVSRTDGKTNTN